MAQFHTTLSERSVYLRYFCSLSLSARVDHERLAANLLRQLRSRIRAGRRRKNESGNGQDEFLGVGRFIGIDASEAEAAILVSDQWQGRGLGTELLAGINRVARAENFQRLSGEILRDNLATQAIFKKLGFRLRLTEDPSSVSAVLDL